MARYSASSSVQSPHALFTTTYDREGDSPALTGYFASLLLVLNLRGYEGYAHAGELGTNP